jgi:hypothetical protein
MDFTRKPVRETQFSLLSRPRGALLIALLVLAMIIIPTIFLRIQSALFERRALFVVHALSALTVGTSSKAEALSRIPTLRADGMGPYGATRCDADECLTGGIPNSRLSDAVFVRAGRKEKRTLYSILSWWGFRFWSLDVYVKFNSGKVSYLSYHLMVSRPHLDDPNVVVVEVTSPERPNGRNSGLSGAEGSPSRLSTSRRWPAQSVGIDFSPGAPKELVAHAFDLNLNCIWSFAGCRTWNQLLPAAEELGR